MRNLLGVVLFICFSGWVSSDPTDDEKENPCHRHTTCSSCTTARYARNTYGGPLERYRKDLSGSREFFQKKEGITSIGQSLRGGKGQALENEEFFVRLDKPFQKECACAWCSLDSSCRSASGHTPCGLSSSQTDASSLISHISQKEIASPRHYECDCPLAPHPYPDDPPSLLPNWMGIFLNETNGAFGSSTLMDLSLPGTHDSITYDLSLTISDDAIDNITMLDDILHAASGGLVNILPGDLEEFLRLQSKTQQLSITQQLDNGIRFIDFRIMMDKRTKDWYSVHFMQSKSKADSYFTEIRLWMDAHPNEIAVIWLSKHGLTDAVGEMQYPDVQPEEKQRLWEAYQSIFADILIDTRESCIHNTSISDLLNRGHRLVTFVSDHREFTDSSPFALDAATIENSFGISGGVFDEPKTMGKHLRYLTKRTDIKQKAKFKLMAMNTAGPGWQIVNAARRRFLPGLSLLGPALDTLDPYEVIFESCALRTNLPGVQQWCPETLLDIAQLNSYYNQITLDKALEWFLHWSPCGSVPSVSFPNAFYLDALDYDGTIRTGSQLLFGPKRSAVNTSHANAKFAYVDTILMYNLHKISRKQDKYEKHVTGDGNKTSNFTTGSSPWSSQNLWNVLIERRNKYPLSLWDDPELGRHSNWPQNILFEHFSRDAVHNVRDAGQTLIGTKPVSSEIRFKDSWWGAVAPQITFQSVYAVFGPRIRYATVKVGSLVLSLLSKCLTSPE